MKSENQEGPSYRSIWRRRGLRVAKAFRFLLVLVVALVLVYLVCDQITWRRVVAQRAEFAQRFGAATFEGLIPEPPAPQLDSGRYYRYAIALVAKADELYGGCSPLQVLHGEDDSLQRFLQRNDPVPPDVAEQYVRRKLDAAQPGLDVALKATSMDQGILFPTYSPKYLLPTLSEVRQLARYLCARAEIAARDGDTGLALEYVRATLHLANAVGESRALIGHLVKVAIGGVAVSTAERVLDQGLPQDADVSGILKELEALRDPEAYVRTLAGENRYMIDNFYTAGPRLWWSLNELRLTKVTFAMADAVEERNPDRQRDLEAQAQQTGDSGPFSLYAMVNLTTPAFVRTMDSWKRLVAETNLLEVGLALARYRSEHDAYPDRLDAVTPYLTREIPTDPYTGAPLKYEKKGTGYVLYSVGEDLTDDHGTALDCHDGKCTGDVVWSIGQPRPAPRASRSRR